MAAEPDGLLVDTHLLLWWAALPEQLPEAARLRLESPDQRLLFSVVSLWEVAIKASLGREDVQVKPLGLRMGMLQKGFRELLIAGWSSTARRCAGWPEGSIEEGPIQPQQRWLQAVVRQR